MADEALTPEERKVLRSLEEQEKLLRGFGRPAEAGDESMFSRQSGTEGKGGGDVPPPIDVPVEIDGENTSGQPSSAFFDPASEGQAQSSVGQDQALINRIDLMVSMLDSLPERIAQAIENI